MLDSRLCGCLLAFLISLPTGSLHAQDKASPPWQGTAFSASPKDITSAAANLRAEQYANITVLADERVVTLDSADRAVFHWHLVYRVESKDGLRWAAAIKATWSPWRQKKPEIRARVMAPDGTVALLDSKVLTDVLDGSSAAAATGSTWCAPRRRPS